MLSTAERLTSRGQVGVVYSCAYLLTDGHWVCASVQKEITGIPRHTCACHMQRIVVMSASRHRDAERCQVGDVRALNMDAQHRSICANLYPQPPASRRPLRGLDRKVVVAYNRVHAVSARLVAWAGHIDMLRLIDGC